MRPIFVAPLVAAAVLLLGAAANDPADRLANPAQEGRARALFREVRCLVCQNESIDESEADLAGDLRRVVRQKVLAGQSDTEIKRYLVQRYGEFVLLKPTFSLGNAILWITPFGLVLGGGAFMLLRAGRRVAASQTPLSIEEEAAIKALDVTET